MSNWKEETLGNIINLIGGGTPKTSVPEYWNGNIPWLSVTDFNNGQKHCFDAEKKITELGLKESSTKVLKKGQLIISARGTVGVVSVLGRDMAFNQSCYGIDAKEDITSNEFLYYLIKDLIPNFKSVAYGAVFDTITRDTFNEIEFLLPPLPEQKAIAEVLSSLDDKIDLLHKQNQKLEELAEILFRQWFIVEADEDIELSDFMEINPREKLSKGTIAPYLEMKNVQSNSSYPSDWYEREFSSGTRFRNGDTLLARITPCLENGKSAYVQFLESDEQVGWGSTEFLVFRTKKGFHPFCSYLLAKNEDFKAFAVGNMTGSSGRQRVQTESLYSFSIGRPSEIRLGELNETFESTALKIDANARQIQKLEKLRNTLLPKFMSGEVRVKMDDK